ncbi:unnamed protein product, partial [Coregonus sp. 'balchen']
NLEMEKKCTIFRDSVCRCQQGHYCNKGKEHCRACYPCTTCGDEGIKVACSATNNTICHAVKEQGGSTLAAVVVLIAVLLVALFVPIYLWRKKKYCFGVDLRPHLPEIANALGWKDMKQVAERSGMKHTAIECHQLDFPNDSQQQCSSLLRAWVEKEGMATASEKLVNTLHRMKKKAKAEDIKAIISSKEHGVTGENSGLEQV